MSKTSDRPQAKRQRKNATSNPSPVQVHYIDYDNMDGDEASPQMLTLKSGLEDMLHPVLDPKQFLDTCFRRKAVHITCKDKQQEEEHCQTRVFQLREEMFDLDPATIMQETSSENIFLWLRKQNDASTDTTENKETIHSIEIADVDTAIALHKTAGHASYCRAPPKVEQCLVSNMLRDTGLGCGQYDPSGNSTISMGRGEVETFMSTPGHMTNWHYDFQENFTIQLSGVKRWTLQAGTIRDPARGCTPHYASPEAVESQLKAAHLYDRKFKFGHPKAGVNAVGDVATVDIKPGDVFYFPAGMWHKIDTIEPGVSINISLMASNYASITCQALQHLLMQDPKWRAPVLNHDGHDAVDMLSQLLEGLPEKIQQLQQSQGGARAILPPILQNPPAFQMDDEGDDDDQEEDVEADNKGDDDGVEQDGNEEDENENNHDDGGGDEEMTEEENEGSVDEQVAIDPADFEDYSDNWTFDHSQNYVRNPLAHFTRQDEISGFYSTPNPEDQNCFVLNVNYAGNEMHQSNVRVEFKVSNAELASELNNLENTGTASLQTVELSHDDEEYSVLKFLVYHGYLVGQ